MRDSERKQMERKVGTFSRISETPFSPLSTNCHRISRIFFRNFSNTKKLQKSTNFQNCCCTLFGKISSRTKKNLNSQQHCGLYVFFRSIDKKVVDSLWFWGDSLWLFTHTLSFSSLISKFYVWREKVLILAGDSYLENIVSFPVNEGIHSFIMFCFNGFLGQH